MFAQEWPLSKKKIPTFSLCGNCWKLQKIAERVRHPQWKIVERVGHPQWKTALRKIPNTYD